MIVDEQRKMVMMLKKAEYIEGFLQPDNQILDKLAKENRDIRDIEPNIGIELYPEMLERCIQLTRKNGLIVADDVLFKPMGIRSELSDPVHQYNEMVCTDERLYTTILPIGDGMAISVKLRD